jgi:hypothetical protein
LGADIFDLGLIAAGGHDSAFHRKHRELDNSPRALSFLRLNQRRENHVGQAHSTIITVHLYGDYPNARLKGSWCIIKKWLQAHGIANSSQDITLPVAKSRTRSKQNKDMRKCSSVYSERGVILLVLTSGGE